MYNHQGEQRDQDGDDAPHRAFPSQISVYEMRVPNRADHEQAGAEDNQREQ
jgi:hypothetical protein